MIFGYDQTKPGEYPLTNDDIRREAIPFDQAGEYFHTLLRWRTFIRIVQALRPMLGPEARIVVHVYPNGKDIYRMMYETSDARIVLLAYAETIKARIEIPRGAWVDTYPYSSKIDITNLLEEVDDVLEGLSDDIWI